MAKQSKSQGLPMGMSYSNLIIGIIVVVAIAAIVVGIIRGRSTTVPSQPEQTEEQQQAEQMSLPTKHTVAAGEDLWKISEKYYKTGYNWVDIANENSITNPNNIAEGMELTIPDVAPKDVETQEAQAATPTPTETPPQPTVTTAPKTQVPTGEAITGDTYTVVKGDYLWKIAVRAYSDGYKWVDIARANKLVNPDVIHQGNILMLPR